MLRGDNPTDQPVSPGTGYFTPQALALQHQLATNTARLEEAEAIVEQMRASLGPFRFPIWPSPVRPG
jgi:hypothetical protein